MRRLVLPLLLTLAACGDDRPRGEAPEPADAGSPDRAAPPAVTYFRDVAPIVEGRCVSCHSAGNVGPFDLTDPERVAQLAPAIRAQVEARLMPPWHAGDGCREYQGDRSLTDAQIATVVEWAEQGAPLGDPADRGAPLDPITGGLSRVDLYVSADADYTPTGTDDYRCFVAEWPETERRFVTGYDLEPSNPAVVHHANFYLVDPSFADDFRAQDAATPEPGFPCFGGVFSFGTALLGAWAPGSLGIEFPAGTGIQVDPGSLVVMEMHFNTGPDRGGPDRSRLALRLEDEVERRALIAPFWDSVNWSQGRRMSIPAGEAAVRHSVLLDPEPLVPFLAPWLTSRAIRIWATGMHMHYLGETGTLHVVRPGGDRECVLEIPRWDFDWQYGYLLEEPIDFTIGEDRLYLECTWDNTAANQPVIDGEQRAPQDTNWGGSSDDEMCIGYIYVTER